MSKVTLFSGINYTNDFLELETGRTILPESWVKKTTSLRVPINMRIRLFDEKIPSNYLEVDKDIPDLSVFRWANRTVRVHIEDLTNLIKKTETFNNCMVSNNNNNSIILILLFGLFIGIILSKFM